MSSRRWYVVLGAVVLSSGLLGSPDPGPPEMTNVRASGVVLPLVANGGQFSSGVLFAAGANGSGVSIREDSIVFGVTPSDGTRLVETPVSFEWSVAPRQPTETTVNYLYGSDPDRWVTGVPSYGSVYLGQFVDGTELSVRVSWTGVEKVLAVPPDGDPDMVRFRVTGHTLSLSDDGRLMVMSRDGVVLGAHTAPVAYELGHDGSKGRGDVAIAYDLVGPNEYGFTVGEYDRTRTLVIDPIFENALIGTFVGGSGRDRNAGGVLQPDGDLLLGGTTVFPASPDLPQANPCSSGPQDGVGGDGDLYVYEIDPFLQELKTATYIGGVFRDDLTQIKIDAAGIVYLAGTTTSEASTPFANTCDASDFPVTTGAERQGGFDSFVMKLPATLDDILASTLIGGSNQDTIINLVVGPAPDQDLYFTGHTRSADLPAPVIPGADAVNDGGFDAFVGRLSNDLLTLEALTLAGGPGPESGRRMTVLSDGVVFVTQGDANFEIDGMQPTAYRGGPSDTVVVKLTPDLNAVSSMVYIGGNDEDIVNSVVPAPGGGFYLGGATKSDNLATNYAVPGFDKTLELSTVSSTHRDGVVYLLAEDLTVDAFTYIGGNGSDGIGNVRLHPDGSTLLATGSTRSSNLASALAPGVAGFQAAPGGPPNGVDLFATRLTNDLTQMQEWTYVGGAQRDEIGGPFLIMSDVLYWVMSSSSDETTLPITDGAFDTSHNGHRDFVILKIGDDNIAAAIDTEPQTESLCFTNAPVFLDANPDPIGAACDFQTSATSSGDLSGHIDPGSALTLSIEPATGDDVLATALTNAMQSGALDCVGGSPFTVGPPAGDDLTLACGSMSAVAGADNQGLATVGPTMPGARIRVLLAATESVSLDRANGWDVSTSSGAIAEVLDATGNVSAFFDLSSDARIRCLDPEAANRVVCEVLAGTGITVSGTASATVSVSVGDEVSIAVDSGVITVDRDEDEGDEDEGDEDEGDEDEGDEDEGDEDE